jgi:hypothetical protein
MATVSFSNLIGGLVKDTNPELLPSNPVVWTIANNVRFTDNSVVKITGSENVITTPISPYYSTVVDDGEKSVIISCGKSKIYAYYSGTWNEITNISGDYINTNNNWQHTVINSYPIFNNGVNRPQSWNQIEPSIKLVDLEGWSSSASCAVIRSFKAYLIAGNITENSSIYNTRVRWSGSALPGALPTTWDDTDITNDAGYIDLSDSPGAIIDMKVLGDNLIIYKQRSTYLMMYIGGNNIFAVKQVFNNVGALTKDCICDALGQHLVVTVDDVILTDGNGYKSIIEGKLRKYLFNVINKQALSACYVTPYYKYSEIWICIPTGSSTVANIAFIYNYSTNVWSTRTLNNIPFISQVPLDISTALSFNASTTPFNSSNYAFNISQYQLNQYFLVGSDPTNNKLLLLETTASTDVGVNMTATLERTNMQLDNDQTIKVIKGLYPKMTKINGSSNIVNFYIGTQMKRNESITWTNAMPFDIINDYKIDLFASGKFISIRIESTGDINWTIENIDVDYVNGGNW